MTPARVLDLRSQGETLQEIADQLSCGRLDAFRALLKAGAILDAPAGRSNIAWRPQ